MDTKALERFCPWARNRLMEAVDLRCRRYGLDDEGRAAAPLGSDVVGGNVLTPDEKRQRAALYARIEECGYGRFLEEMAYTWFNRFMAIRYMELHDYLSSRVRMLSSVADGDFRPDCIRVASELELPGLDKSRVLDLMDAADDEGLFRLILLAQCNELADALPEVFGHLGAADELMLPDGLLRTGENDVLYHLVTDISEETWQDVEILGWMYQFYNSERKDDFFKSKRKASADDLAPATQLFTPKWIVQYLVENSLGRLWMLNNPSSHLKDQMKYFIAPDDEHEDFIRINGPEDITFCDPACGSGHILSYAFELLYAMYEERGYRPSEIPELILEKNLTGFEIDERAAQIASLVLAMRAREHDRRFLKRDVTARIYVFNSVDCEGADLPKSVSEQLEHLGEIGSLVRLTEKDLGSIHVLAREAGTSLLDSKLAESLRAIEPALSAISNRYDVVVANPPYMGSSSFNPFMSSWIKKNYADVKSDLCTCFIERSYDFADKYGYSSMVTMQSWMFLGSFEKMRNRLIDEKAIVSMAHLGPRAFDAIGGEVVSVTAAVLYNSSSHMKGTYFRLVDIVGSDPKREKLLEAISNPTCGWFYRADASTFHDIPGSPIAYWASEAIHKALNNGISIDTISDYTGSQNITANNEKYLRYWWEVPGIDSSTWIPYSKGGRFRRWYGNNDYVIDWSDAAKSFYQSNSTSNLLNQRYWYKPGITYSDITSGKSHFRFLPAWGAFDKKGPEICGLGNNLKPVLAFLNSSVCQCYLWIFNPSMTLQVADIKNLPLLNDVLVHLNISALTDECIGISEVDWDSQETSWGFKFNHLVHDDGERENMSATLLLGNGINRSLLRDDEAIWDEKYLIDSGPHLKRSASWGEVLNALAERHDINQTNFGVPDEFDSLVGKALESQSHLDSISQDKFEIMMLRFLAKYFSFVGEAPLNNLDFYQNQLLSVLKSLADKQLSIVSTNYDVLMEKVIFPLESPYQISLTGNCPPQQATFKRRGVSFFHAHGSVQRGETIVLGEAGYLRNIYRIFDIIDFNPGCTKDELISVLKELTTSENGFGKYNKLDNFISYNSNKILSSRNEKIRGTWLGRLFFSDVSVVGFKMGNEEIDIWLALYLRHKLREINDSRFPMDTGIRYFCKQGELNNAELNRYKNRGIEVVEINADSYEEVYIEALKMAC